MTEMKTDGPLGTQTLFRALAVIEAIAKGAGNLQTISAATGCTRSTTHRVVSALIHAKCIQQCPRQGYVLGSKLIEFGLWARGQMPLTALARPHLEALAVRMRHAVQLGIAEESEVLILDEIAGRRGPMHARIGSRMPLALTGLGKALMLDMAEDQWRRHYDAGMAHPTCRGTAPSGSAHWQGYLERMRLNAARACTFDLEENEIGTRCISAPVREACGRIVAAVGLVSVVRVVGEERKRLLCREVVATAAAISADLGWIAHKMNGVSSPISDKVRRRVQVR